MKVVILDKDTLSAGDLDFSVFREFGEVAEYTTAPLDEVVKRLEGVDAVFSNRYQITRELIERCPSVKYIGTFSTGVNQVDLNACREHGITVCNANGYSTYSVAQHAITLMLLLAERPDRYESYIREGKWTNFDARLYLLGMQELYGKTFGIFGFGNIGKEAARIAEAFGMNVIVCTLPADNCPYPLVSKEELFARSDFLSLHAPLTPATKNLVNEETLSLMKRTAVIINTARGGLIDEHALTKALNEGRIAGAGLDATVHEPLLPTDEILTAKNCVITPHVGWSPTETRQRLVGIVANNYREFLKGNPVNVVT